MEKEVFILKNKEFFLKWSKYYDLFTKFVRIIHEISVNSIEPLGKLKILDICTGTGSLASRFAKHEHDVTGLDLSEAMLEKAMKNYKAATLNKGKHNGDLGNLKFMVGDASNLPFEDATFDICSVSFGLHDMPHAVRIKSLKEMMRAVKPSGYLFIIDYNRPKNIILKHLYYLSVKIYESEFYPSWYWGDYLKRFMKDNNCRIKIDRTFMGGFARLLILKPNKRAPSLIKNLEDRT